MNPIIENLFKRKSVRVFEDIEISEKDKHCILEATTMGFWP